MPAASRHPHILDLTPPPGARVRVLSDLHYGHARCEAPPVEELSSLLDGVDFLVIAGDLAETRESAWQAEGIQSREQLHALCQQRGVTLITLAGNHDPDAGPQLLNLWGGKVAIMHGHALYKECSPWGWEYLRHRERFHECIACYPHADSDLEQRLELSSRICQLTLPNMQEEHRYPRMLRGIMHCFFPPRRPFMIVWSWLTFSWRANAFARRFLPQSEVLVLGHFHRSGHWRFGKRRIVNTGAWYKHASSWVADLREGKLVEYRRAR